MADAELVEHVRIRGRKIGYRVLAQYQALKHWLVDDPADLLLVGAQRRQPCGIDRGLDQLAIHSVEIDDGAGGAGLLPERH